MIHGDHIYPLSKISKVYTIMDRTLHFSVKASNRYPKRCGPFFTDLLYIG